MGSRRTPANAWRRSTTAGTGVPPAVSADPLFDWVAGPRRHRSVRGAVLGRGVGVATSQPQSLGPDLRPHASAPPPATGRTPVADRCGRRHPVGRPGPGRPTPGLEAGGGSRIPARGDRHRRARQQAARRRAPSAWSSASACRRPPSPTQRESVSGTQRPGPAGDPRAPPPPRRPRDLSGTEGCRRTPATEASLCSPEHLDASQPPSRPSGLLRRTRGGDHQLGRVANALDHDADP